MKKPDSKTKKERGDPQTLFALYEERKAAIRARLEEFAHVPPERYFYELVYCLMTPQTSARNADIVVSQLRQFRFNESGIDPEPFLREKTHYIRFHKTKARHLLKAREDFHRVLKALMNGYSPRELREWLVGNVIGLGYKEATHFLRNIGKSGGLAILDRHILRNLKRFGALRRVPAGLTRKSYLTVERRFTKFSEAIGIPLDELDLLFWSMETGEIRK